MFRVSAVYAADLCLLLTDNKAVYTYEVGGGGGGGGIPHRS